MLPRFPPPWFCELSSLWTPWLPHHQATARPELRCSYCCKGKLVCVDTSLLIRLHWLPIRRRILYKIAQLAYKCYYGIALSYLCDLVSPYRPSRSLRTADSLLLTVPRLRLDRYGLRSFSFAAPTVWNSLPLDLRKLSNATSFSSALKTLLFDPPPHISSALNDLLWIHMLYCLLFFIYCERLWSVFSDCKGRFINPNILWLLNYSTLSRNRDTPFLTRF